MPLNGQRRVGAHPIAIAIVGYVLAASSGCIDSNKSAGPTPDLIWGVQGIEPGQLQKPRAIAIDANDQIYLVDMTARIQVYDDQGKYLRGWKTPESVNGRPTGLSIAKNGHVWVPDTHYYRVLAYDPDGQPIDAENFGGVMGPGPGEFAWVTDVVEDSEGSIYVSEYGDTDRIQKFSRDGKFLLQWGGTGEEPGQFRRPQSMAVDADDNIWVADACNHRIQVFDKEGQLINHWGQEGSGPGELYYPYGLALDGKGHLYVCEYGNHRVQKFDLNGKSLGIWGAHGREPGQLHNPWAVAFDSKGRLYVLDSSNNRVQRVAF